MVEFAPSFLSSPCLVPSGALREQAIELATKPALSHITPTLDPAEFPSIRRECESFRGSGKNRDIFTCDRFSSSCCPSSDPFHSDSASPAAVDTTTT